MEEAIEAGGGKEAAVSHLKDLWLVPSHITAQPAGVWINLN